MTCGAVIEAGLGRFVCSRPQGHYPDTEHLDDVFPGFEWTDQTADYIERLESEGENNALQKRS